LTRIIGDNTQRLNRLVAEVLELGRRTRAQPEPLPLKAFVQHFLDEYAVHDPRVLEIVRLEGDPQAVLLFDRGHLEQVLSNLVSNALRHGTGASAGVRVDIRPGVSGRPEGGHTELHLVDDGLGIAEAVASQIFEPFFTNHPQGTGLGLYIARELCEANGAQLLFRGNAPGAHFCVIGKGAGDENDQGCWWSMTSRIFVSCSS
jgi:two-component system sensor histidine kinase PilS (NtrC family)